MNVLIVEPAKLYQEIIGHIVNENGASAVIVQNGEQALAKSEEMDFGMVCIPRYLPDMDGVHFLHELRRHEKQVLAPVVLITADDHEALRSHSIQIGFTEVLSKNDTDALSDNLGLLIRNSETQVKGKVLLVEDSISIARFMQEILESHDVIVDQVTTGAEALRLFEANAYDLVVTDVFLEDDITGMALVQAIKSRNDDKHLVPILAVSGSDDGARRIEILRQGANDFVSKPIQPEEFVVRSQNLIKAKKLYDHVLSQQEQLSVIAMTDHLTSLYNRHSLNELAPKMISEAYRHNQPLTLMVVDLDHFKKINDTHGHDKGDYVLREVGALLKGAFREEDMVARFGGEEFVILCSHCSQEDGMTKAELVRQELQVLKPDGLPISGSIGVTSLPMNKKVDFEYLFKQADEAVYEAKHNGRNQVVGRLFKP